MYSSKPHQIKFKACINGQIIAVEPQQTLLNAALQQQVALKHKCRVGACGSCKCQLISGQVNTNKNSAYILSEQEIANGTILACQTLLLSDIQIQAQIEASLINTKHAISHNIVAQADKPTAQWFDYLKYFLFHIVGLCSALAFLAGGGWISLGLLSVTLFYVLGDAFLGQDNSTPHFQYPKILTIQLWAALPLLFIIIFSFIWAMVPGDPFNFGALIQQYTSINILSNKVNTGVFHQLLGIVYAGLMIGMIGTITAHELTHRTWDKVSLLIGRLLLAFSFDTIFSIEHVYGHHRYVATSDDPATAPRGRNVYYHIWISTIKGNISAWKIEKQRLQRLGHSIYSWHNKVITGHSLSLGLVLIAFWLASWQGALFFILSAILGKCLLEVVNYMEHYGIVRIKDSAVQIHHSWNTNRKVSSWSMFNLTRHSHHHAQGEVPYHDLQPIPNAPVMIGGYLTTIIVALIPPLWFHLMEAKVTEWDEFYASEAEREIITQSRHSII
jgi:ferredoxin